MKELCQNPESLDVYQPRLKNQEGQKCKAGDQGKPSEQDDETTTDGEKSNNEGANASDGETDSEPKKKKSKTNRAESPHKDMDSATFSLGSMDGVGSPSS